MVSKWMQEGAESPTALQDSGESSLEEGPTDVEGSQQWFKSLSPRHLPFLAVMPNAEVSTSLAECCLHLVSFDTVRCWSNLLALQCMTS